MSHQDQSRASPRRALDDNDNGDEPFSPSAVEESHSADPPRDHTKSADPGVRQQQRGSLSGRDQLFLDVEVTEKPLAVTRGYILLFDHTCRMSTHHVQQLMKSAVYTLKAPGTSEETGAFVAAVAQLKDIHVLPSPSQNPKGLGKFTINLTKMKRNIDGAPTSLSATPGLVHQWSLLSSNLRTLAKLPTHEQLDHLCVPSREAFVRPLHLTICDGGISEITKLQCDIRLFPHSQLPPTSPSTGPLNTSTSVVSSDAINTSTTSFSDIDKALLEPTFVQTNLDFSPRPLPPSATMGDDDKLAEDELYVGGAPLEGSEIDARVAFSSSNAEGSGDRLEDSNSQSTALPLHKHVPKCFYRPQSASRQAVSSEDINSLCDLGNFTSPQVELLLHTTLESILTPPASVLTAIQRDRDDCELRAFIQRASELVPSLNEEGEHSQPTADVDDETHLLLMSTSNKNGAVHEAMLDGEQRGGWTVCGLSYLHLGLVLQHLFTQEDIAAAQLLDEKKIASLLSSQEFVTLAEPCKMANYERERVHKQTLHEKRRAFFVPTKKPEVAQQTPAKVAVSPSTSPSTVALSGKAVEQEGAGGSPTPPSRRSKLELTIDGDNPSAKRVSSYGPEPTSPATKSLRSHSLTSAAGGGATASSTKDDEQICSTMREQFRQLGNATPESTQSVELDMTNKLPVKVVQLLYPGARSQRSQTLSHSETISPRWTAGRTVFDLPSVTNRSSSWITTHAGAPHYLPLMQSEGSDFGMVGASLVSPRFGSLSSTPESPSLKHARGVESTARFGSMASMGKSGKREKEERQKQRTLLTSDGVHIVDLTTSVKGSYIFQALLNVVSVTPTSFVSPLHQRSAASSKRGSENPVAVTSDEPDTAQPQPGGQSPQPLSHRPQSLLSSLNCASNKVVLPRPSSATMRPSENSDVSNVAVVAALPRMDVSILPITSQERELLCGSWARIVSGVAENQQQDVTGEDLTQKYGSLFGSGDNEGSEEGFVASCVETASVILDVLSGDFIAKDEGDLTRDAVGVLLLLHSLHLQSTITTRSATSAHTSNVAGLSVADLPNCIGTWRKECTTTDSANSAAVITLRFDSHLVAWEVAAVSELLIGRLAISTLDVGVAPQRCDVDVTIGLAFVPRSKEKIVSMTPSSPAPLLSERFERKRSNASATSVSSRQPHRQGGSVDLFPYNLALSPKALSLHQIAAIIQDHVPAFSSQLSEEMITEALRGGGAAAASPTTNALGINAAVPHLGVSSPSDDASPTFSAVGRKSNKVLPSTVSSASMITSIDPSSVVFIGFLDHLSVHLAFEPPTQPLQMMTMDTTAPTVRMSIVPHPPTSPPPNASSRPKGVASGAEEPAPSEMAVSPPPETSAAPSPIMAPTQQTTSSSSSSLSTETDDSEDGEFAL